MTQILNYSEKAIAVIGDNKAIKEQLKALGGRFNKYLKCGAGWIFSAGKRAEVEAFLNGGAAPKKSAQGLEEKVAILTKYCRKAEGRYRKEATPEMITRWAKNNYFVLDIDGHCFEIAKPSIKTDFCHPDEPAEAVKAFYSACRTYDYFEAENMQDFERALSRLDDGFACVKRESWTGESYISTSRYGQKGESIEDLTDNIKAALKEAYNKAIELHKKRLQTWWKKYGADKLHCWTYWADR